MFYTMHTEVIDKIHYKTFFLQIIQFKETRLYEINHTLLCFNKNIKIKKKCLNY